MFVTAELTTCLPSIPAHKTNNSLYLHLGCKLGFKEADLAGLLIKTLSSSAAELLAGLLA